MPSIHIRRRMMANFRATTTLALRSSIRFASLVPQALSAEHFSPPRLVIRRGDQDTICQIKYQLMQINRRSHGIAYAWYRQKFQK